MRGKHLGSLELFQVDKFGRKEKVWEKAGTDMGLDWIQGGLYVGKVRFSRFEFVGTKGKGFQGDIALDDVNFGQCSPCKFSLIF